MKTRIVSSINLVLTFIEHFPHKIKNIYITDDKNPKIVKLLEKKGIDFEFVRDPLSTEKKGVHQHIWARVHEYKYVDFEDLKNLDKILILDQITDPHNFGAMARTAHQLGFEGVILQTRNCVSVTETVSRISTGAVEFLKVAQVGNIRNAMKSLKQSGFEIFATDMKGIPLQEINFSEKIAVVMGSEGKGVRYMIKEDSDYLVSIPMVGKLDSVNVSNAFAIVAWEVVRGKI